MKRLMMAAFGFGLIAAGAPSHHALAQQAPVQGQQNSQPSPTQNQGQYQTNNAQQPPQEKVLPPTQASQDKPNPLPAANSK